jgi:hypothetical protein
MRATLRAARVAALALALACGGSAGATAAEVASPAAAEPGSAEPWVERMLGALRLGDTLAARIRAHTVDHTFSKRDVVIEILRDARGPTMRTLVEVRDAEDGEEIRPVVFRLDTAPDGSVVSWLWDIRWQRFVRMSGLDGTENFDGTHFHLEDLGFTGLRERRSGSARELAEGGVVEITSGAYQHYGRVETRIDRVTGLPRRTHIYDGTGARIWEIDFEAVESVGGRALPTRMSAKNPITRERSTLEWAQIAVGVRISEEAFDLERLDVVIRRGGDPIEFPEPPDAGPAPSAGAPQGPHAAHP